MKASVKALKMPQSPNALRKLKGKVAIVTGASRGIGRATAKLFALEGANVVVNYNSSDRKAEKLCEEIKKLGGDCLPVKADVSCRTDVETMIARTIAKYGRIDILVNNAGVTFRRRLLESTKEQWDRTIAVNLKGVYLCSKAVAPIMLKQKGGRIVNISSVAGISGHARAIEIPDYVASKAGVIGLTRALAANLAPNVNVNVVCPGAIETDIAKALTEETRRRIIREAPLGRFGRPEEVAKAVLFLSCSDSDFVTGETLVVAGGRPLT